MNFRFKGIVFTILLISILSAQDKKVFPGANEKTPSRSEYFSWINNTNEGATEEQAIINLEFFKWMQDEFGMTLDIYAFDAGAIDGKRFYGSIYSDRFKKQFPNGFDPIYEKAKSIGTRLGVWGGPDGFGKSKKSAQNRIDEMVKLCKDYDFALFKFDAVCGPLPLENEDYFIEMMEKCRTYSPDLILLNHRLGLERAEKYATTFLWEGAETYVDIFSVNPMTAPHHRAGALSRGLVPGLQRLTEDHGVCISSCLDYWDDDLVLQAFNRNLILSPQIYGSPWFLKDNEFPKLARIFNLHRKYRDIMVNGTVLPEEKYGKYAVSRGDENTRIVTLRNLSWEPVKYTIELGEEIGLNGNNKIELRQFHPVEKVIGYYDKGNKIEIEVKPFRSCLLIASSEKITEVGIDGCDYEVVKDINNAPVKIKLKAFAGEDKEIKLIAGNRKFTSAKIDGQDISGFVNGKNVKLKFIGTKAKSEYHRKLERLVPTEMPSDSIALYEATCFAADNNALEIRSKFRSGETNIPQVKAARDAFFNQPVLRERGVWDKNLFDGDMETGFFPSKKYKRDVRVNGGCFRLDLGEVTNIDQLIIRVPDQYSLHPLLNDEGNYAEISSDLINWERITYLAGKEMVIDINKQIRYVRLKEYPSRITEIEAIYKGVKLNREKWRASNLFSHPSRLKFENAWSGKVKVEEVFDGNYICVAVNGKHGKEGVYAALKVDGNFIGAFDRSVSFPSNTWEYVIWNRGENYTYYFPIDKKFEGKEIEIHLIGFDKENIDINPEVWLTAYPAPYKEKLLILE